MAALTARFYDRLMRATEDAGLRAWRVELLAPLSGTVLEVGAGTGLNLAHYPAAVERLVVSEPDRHMRAKLAETIAARDGAAAVVEISEAGAEQLALEDASVDAVVCTLVLCTVPDPQASLAEVRRVLRPGGTFVFLEHVCHGRRWPRFWQHVFDPVWKRVAGGCHLTRRTRIVIQEAGFEIEELIEAPMPRGPFWVRPTIRGRAQRPL